MSHQASSAGLSYLGTHHSPDWFDDNVSVKGLRFAGCFLWWMCMLYLTGAAFF